jgi:hypothetical protein
VLLNGKVAGVIVALMGSRALAQYSTR